MDGKGMTCVLFEGSYPNEMLKLVFWKQGENDDETMKDSTFMLLGQIWLNLHISQDFSDLIETCCIEREHLFFAQIL